MARTKLLTRLIAPLAIITLSVGVATGAGAAPSRVPGQTKGTLVIGNISNATGTTSLPSTGAFDTLKAWAKDVNSRGGVNGYKISVKTADDKADPAKASEAIKTLIEDDHAIAIVGEYAGGTASMWQPIADAAGVPIIGGGCYDSTQNTDQNFYCVTTTAILDGLLAQAKFVADQGGKKIGITYDSSQPQAAAAAPLMKTAATKYGMQFTDGLGVTNTQPDYTATCVTFKQGGTTDVGIEGAPLLPNLARDCARQGYSPRWTSGDGQISQNSWLKDPNIKEAIAAIYSFPYLDTSSPGNQAVQHRDEEVRAQRAQERLQAAGDHHVDGGDGVREGGRQAHRPQPDRSRRDRGAQHLQQRDPRRAGAEPDHLHRRPAARATTPAGSRWCSRTTS